MTEFDRLDEIRAGVEHVRNGGLAVVFKNLFPDVPSWEQFINHTNLEFNNPPGQIPMQPKEERFVNGVLIRNLFYLMVSNPSDKAYPQSIPLRITFNEVLEDSIWPVSAFVNFVGGEQPIAPHVDMRETVYWQCQGTVVWKIYAEEHINDENKYKIDPAMEITLDPGDVIFVGFKVGHSVVTPGPRAAIGFQHKQDDQGRFDEGMKISKKHYENLGITNVKGRNS